jgi:hypothetical protein
MDELRPGDTVHFVIPWFRESNRAGTVVGRRLILAKGGRSDLLVYHIYEDHTHSLYYITPDKLLSVERHENWRSRFLAAEDRYRDSRRESSDAWRQALSEDPNQPMFFWNDVPTRDTEAMTDGSE